MKCYQVGIVGFGGAGNKHRQLIPKTSCMSVRGAFDLDKARQDAIRDAGLTVYASLDELLSDPEVDIALVTLPNNYHKSAMISALVAGKHVICEKPVTVNAADFEDVLAISKTTGKQVFVHQNRRWDMDFQMMKQVYDSGILGDITHITVRGESFPGIIPNWRNTKAAGGGQILDWGVHHLDRLLYMVGQRVVSVYASVKNVFGEVDDFSFTQLTFQNGITATVELGAANCVPQTPYIISGTKGSAIISEANRDGGVAKVLTLGPGDPNVRGPNILIEERAFKSSFDDWLAYYSNVAAVLDGTEELIVKNEQVLDTLRVIDAIFLSAEKNQVVML